MLLPATTPGLGRGLLLPAAAAGREWGRGVAPRMRDSSSWRSHVQGAVAALTVPQYSSCPFVHLSIHWPIIYPVTIY